jgi:hypothetical protein
MMKDSRQKLSGNMSDLLSRYLRSEGLLARIFEGHVSRKERWLSLMDDVAAIENTKDAE